jgi:hypothetical protein
MAPMSVASVLLTTGVAAFFIFSWVVNPKPKLNLYHHIIAPKPAIPLKDLMRFLITCLLLGAGLYIILSSQYTPSDKNWAYGTIGTLVGYWLRPTR